MKILKYISSWRLTVILLLGFCALYIYFTFGEKPFERWIGYIFHDAQGLIIYIGLILNIIALSLRIVYTRLQRREVTSEGLRMMDAFVEFPQNNNNLFKEVTAWMGRKGFPAEVGGKEVHSLKGRFSFLPGTILRVGVIMIMIALLFSTYLRKTEESLFHEGDSGMLLGKKLEVENIKFDMPDEFLHVGETGNFSMGALSGALSESQKENNISGGFPSNFNGLYYRIINFGYSQPISVEASPLKIERNLDLDILPPGKADIVTIPSYNLLMTFALQPDKTIKKGLLTGKLFNLRIPHYSIAVQKGDDKDKIEIISIKPEEEVTAKRYNISLGKNSFFVRIQSVYDPALLWIYIGILLTLTGTLSMPSRFFWYEKEIAALVKDNNIFIGYREEFYKKWGIQKFYGWIEELASNSKN